MGVAQMELLPSFIKRKKEIIAYYKKALTGVGDIEFQQVSDEVDPNWWLPTIKSSRQRDILKILNENKFQSRPFWVPMNQLPMFTGNIYYQKNDRSDYLYRHCLSIPCSTNITDEQLEAVSNKIKELF
jgi:dTDP-4-amino-4,6-dideoxygalactose transaminase